nr:MAG TPA: late control gene D protein [Caudoviricetes sp.]
MSQRVRIDYTANGQTWGLGVFLLSAPTRSYSEAGSTWSVDLSSPLALPDADCVDRTYTVKAGTNLVDAAAGLLRETGLARLSITPSTAVASSDIVYDPGKSRLTIANELLAAAGYWSAHPDGEGQVHLDPYVRPAARGVAYDFREGARSVHLPEWERELDMASVPNKVVLVSEGSQDKAALVGVATNEDPASLYSFQARGRWIVDTQTGVEAANQASIDSQARRRLIDVSTPSASITLQHMPVPIQPNQVVGFSSQGHSAQGVVREISYTLDPTALVRTKLLEVTDL